MQTGGPHGFACTPIPDHFMKKKKLADIVIFIGMAINAIVIVLILYFYVF